MQIMKKGDFILLSQIRSLLLYPVCPPKEIYLWRRIEFTCRNRFINEGRGRKQL